MKEQKERKANTQRNSISLERILALWEIALCSNAQVE